MGELTTPVPRALFPSVLSARDTVAGTYPRDQLVSIPELGTSLGRNSRVMGHPRLTDSPPLPHLCHRSQSCRVSGTASLTPGALGSRLGGQFGSHTKPGALALPSPVLPNPQPAAPSLPAQQLPAAWSCTGLSARSVFSRCLSAAGGE